MAEDWAANVKKYVPDADDGIIAGIVRYCGIALQKRDSSLVSFGDPAETKRVRENFLKKKLGLTDSDDMLDAAIAKVGERMKGENFRNRVTVYYLLAEQFGKLQVFAKAAKSAKAPAASKKPAASTKAAAGATGAARLASPGASETRATASRAKPTKTAGTTGAVAAGAVSGVSETVAGAAAAEVTVAASAKDAPAQSLKDSLADDKHTDATEAGSSGLSWLMWLVLIAVVLGVLWWQFYGKPSASSDSKVANVHSHAAARQA